MSTERFDVLVVGGGMVGSALALLLSRQGCSVALVEPNPPVPFDPSRDYDLRVSALSPASCNLLNEAGAWSWIQDHRHCTYTAMKVWEESGGPVLDFNAGEAGVASLGAIVENSLILDAIWKQLDGVKIYCPDSLVALDIREEGATARLESGRVLESQLIVASDGAASATRRLAGIETFGWQYQQKGIVCVVRTSDAHGNTAWQRFLPSGPLAFLPLEDGRCSIVWSARDALAGELLGVDDSTFCARLTDASEGCLGEVTAVGPRAVFPLKFLQAEQFIRPNVALVGDAAHVIHPLAGQGVNLGFADIDCLVGLLVEARESGRRLGNLKVLRRYERARKAEDALMAQLTDGLSRLYSTEQDWLRTGRQQGVRVVNLLGPLKRSLMQQALGT